MIFHNIALVAGFGLASEALLLPSSLMLPDFSVEEGSDEFTALRMPDDFVERLENLHIAINRIGGTSADGEWGESAWGEGTQVELRCNECALPAATFATEFLVDPESNYLQLDFAVSGQSLTLNGYQLYPSNGGLGGPSADLVKQNTQDFTATYYPGQLVYMAGAAIVEAADGTDAKLIDIQFQIMGFDGTPVSVDGISIRMLTDENDNLRLVHVIESPTDGSPQNGFTHNNEIFHDTPKAEFESHDEPAQPCPVGSGLAQTLCRLRFAIAQQMKAWHLVKPSGEGDSQPDLFQPCSGGFESGYGSGYGSRFGSVFESVDGAEGEARPPFVKGGPMKFIPIGGLSSHSDQFDHRHQGFHHGFDHGFVPAFATTLRAFVLGFLMPVMIGVLAGMSASILGMLTGTALAWLWVKVVRGGKRGNASGRQAAREAAVAEEDEVVTGEKAGLLEHAPACEADEGLPAYAEKE